MNLLEQLIINSFPEQQKNIFEAKNQEIAELKKEVEKLTIERDVLLRIKG